MHCEHDTSVGNSTNERTTVLSSIKKVVKETQDACLPTTIMLL